MECSCIVVDIDDGYTANYQRAKEVIATKQFKCHECYSQINKGDKFEVAVYQEKEKGDYEFHNTCIDCLSVRDNFFCNYYYGMIWELLDNEIDDSGGNINMSCIAKLTPTARDKVCDMLDRYYEINNEDEYEDDTN